MLSDWMSLLERDVVPPILINGTLVYIEAVPLSFWNPEVAPYYYWKIQVCKGIREARAQQIRYVLERAEIWNEPKSAAGRTGWAATMMPALRSCCACWRG